MLSAGSTRVYPGTQHITNPLLMWKTEEHQQCVYGQRRECRPNQSSDLISVFPVTAEESFQLSSKLLFIISTKKRRGASSSFLPLPKSRNALLSLLTKKAQQSSCTVPSQKGEGSSSGNTDLRDDSFWGCLVGTYCPS